MSDTLPIVYLYPPAQWESNTSRQGFITEALREYTQVIFLSVPDYGLSPFSVRLPYAEEIGKNATIIRNSMMLRHNRYWKRLGALAAHLDAFAIHRVLRRKGIVDYVFWISVPGPEWMAGMRQDRMIYDCIDPNFFPDDQAGFDAIEFEVAAHSKMIFCTAETLLQRMEKVHSNVHLLQNAASLEVYEAERTSTLGLPEMLRGRPRPIIGYMGTTDSRVDTETIFAAASALPEYTFCIAGRVNQDQEYRVTELRKLPNVVMPGQISREEGAAYNKAFDVGIIPYLPGYVGDGINPVKMYMYLLTGKPVVSTWINECRLNMPLVAATRTPEEFIAALRQAVNEPDTRNREARIAFAMKNTWQDRARQAIELMRSSGLFGLAAPRDNA